MWSYENDTKRQGFVRVAGIDEAGRGPLAGPVVSAAVILPDTLPDLGISDSKKLTAKQRASVYPTIYQHALAIGIGIVDAAEIDRINILQASLRSMAIAALNLEPSPDCLLIDGTFPIPLPTRQITIPKGDTLSISISAASIVAKVTRDRMMDCYDVYYPHYCFKSHKGYPTKAHREAIRKFGSSPIHRHSFKGVTWHPSTVTPRCAPLP